MTSEFEKPLERLSADWQSTGKLPAPSVEEMRRQAKRFAWGGIGNIGVGITLLVIFTALAVRDPRPARVVAGLGVWVFVLVAVGFDLWNRRRTWRVVGLNTREFADVLGYQMVARVRGLQFAWGLLAAEMAFFIPWIAWVVGERENVTIRSYMGPYSFLAAVVLAFGFTLFCLQRGARRSLNGVRAFQHSMKDDS